MDNRIFQLREKMSKNLAKNWTTEQMAKAVKVSISHFIKIFRAETGVAPIAWLRDRRLEKARELLEGDWEHIHQIGLQVGMPNDSHFTRDFKNKYGKTPTAYRREYHDRKQAEVIFAKK